MRCPSAWRRSLCAKPSTLRTPHEMMCEPSSIAGNGCYKVRALAGCAGRAFGYDQCMEITERPIETILSLTPTAAVKIRELMAEEPDGETTVLRVAIQGGGCSGFQYGLGFDTGAPRVTSSSSSRASASSSIPSACPYLQGATIDFLTGLQESGFKIDNPNAASSCGCGHSFQVAEGEELPEGTTPAAAAPAARTSRGRAASTRILRRDCRVAMRRLSGSGVFRMLLGSELAADDGCE